MFSIQQLIKALRMLQSSGCADGNSLKQNLKSIGSAISTTTTTTKTIKEEGASSLLEGSFHRGAEGGTSLLPATSTSQLSLRDTMISPSQPRQLNEYSKQLLLATDSSQIQTQKSYQHKEVQVICRSIWEHSVSPNSSAIEKGNVTVAPEYQIAVNTLKTSQEAKNYNTIGVISQTTSRSERIQTFYQLHLIKYHTQNNYQSLKNTQIYNKMSSLAAVTEPKCVSKQEDPTNLVSATNGQNDKNNTASCNGKEENHSSSDKPCFKTGFGEILKFMELLGNLKHTKRTGWVLRNVSDPESISGHMYRMSMMTFLLDGSEGLNPIRCMELALVHDLAECVVGDLTPFCGVSAADKHAMEFKAMEDICKLIEPRGERIMELFEEYEKGESAESKFVKDLDRLDLIMQAFEYEKRDNCLLKHQEFFDSNEGKFNHPFVKKIVDEIYIQRQNLARSEGATPTPQVQLPSVDALPSTNVQHSEHGGAQVRQEVSTTDAPKSNTDSTN